MKKIFLFLAAIVLMTSITSAAWAETSEEKKLTEEAAALDKDGGTPDGEKVVAKRLESEFNVDEARIKGLREKKLGYGEIGIVLSMAQKMPGGITDANVNTIMSMRQGPPVEGWGVIAKKLGFNLGHIVSNVERVRKESHKEIEKSEHMKGEKMEKHERLEKPERIEKPKKPERHEMRGH